MFSDLADYYLRWYHERPVGITSARRDELRRLHGVLYRACKFFAEHYGEFVPGMMPLGEKDMQILEIQSQYPFRAGTWRPDYIVAEDGSLRICEITSRFFGHGIFLTWFAEKAADLFMERFPGSPRESLYPGLFECMSRMPGDKRKIFVLKSSDRSSAIRLYKRLYESLGHEVAILEAEEVESSIRLWDRDDVFIINALNQKDILSFGLDTIRAMAARGMVSGFRNTFLLHDKRFMGLWFDDRFTSRCLSPEDTAFLRAHAIETYATDDPSSEMVLADAYVHKDNYILKPTRLGKSEGLYAGPLTGENTWKGLWRSRPDGRFAPEGMVLQPFIRQKAWPVEWEGRQYLDYLCGMMLCVDDKYYDSGVFRASSLPVTNVGDDRKACAVLTDDPEILQYCDVL